MPNYNRVILIGNLTRDPELRILKGETSVCHVGLAINRVYRNQNGDKQEEVTFVDCEAWRSNAETIAKYLTKGSPIHIEGRLRLDQWHDKEGNERSKLKVVIERFQFVDSMSPRTAEEPTTSDTIDDQVEENSPV